MNPLDTDALYKVCEEVARTTMWVTPAPHSLQDIITSEEIKATIAGYFEGAVREAEFLTAAGEDPNLVISAIDYLAAHHAIAPMQDDQGWLREALHTVLVMARPAITGAEPSNHAFLDEVLQGIAEAKGQKG